MDRNTFRILVATDNHLGSFEKAPLRRDDSFVTFEEILATAVQEKVDLLLLCGDLFDENKPSHATLHRTMNLLRKYCLGSRSVDFQLVSDPRNSLSNGDFGVANFQDANLNVSLPVFAIHGNHDDPVGEHALSALDLLSSAGLINYFGKSLSNDQIRLNPLLLRKGDTKLAMYGLGHMREERLHRCFLHKKVTFTRPEDPDSWFSLMAIHQNRNVKGVGRKNGVKEEMLKGFLDLVFWGHEHDTQLAPVPAAGGAGYDIIQPGSSVMASPGADEQTEKKVCLLEVEGTAYRATPVPLLSTRPVEMETVVLSEEDGLARTVEEVSEYLTERAEELIQRAHHKVSRIPDAFLQKHKDLRIPIVRIKVDYSPDFPVVNPVLFGGKFMNRVANPHHILVNQKAKKKPNAAPGDPNASDTLAGGAGAAAHASTDVTKALRHATAEAEASGGNMSERIASNLHDMMKGLGMFSEFQMTEAVFSFIEKSESNAVHQYVNDYNLRAQKGIWKDVRGQSGVEGEQVRKLASTIKEHVDREWRAKADEPAAAASPQSVQRAPAVKLEEMAGDMPAEPPALLARATPDSAEIDIQSSANSSHVDALGPLDDTPTAAAAAAAAAKKPAAKRAARKPAAKKAATKAAKRGRGTATPPPLPGFAPPKEEAADDVADASQQGTAPPPAKRTRQPSQQQQQQQQQQPPSQQASQSESQRQTGARASTASVLAAWGKRK